MFAVADIMLSMSPQGGKHHLNASRDCVLALQVTPCAWSTGTDDPDFTTDKATQTAGVDLRADNIDTAVRIREATPEGVGADCKTCYQRAECLRVVLM